MVTTPPSISEKEFLAQVRQLARMFGWKTYHTHNSAFSEGGFPDLVLVRGDRILFCRIEGKDQSECPPANVAGSPTQNRQGRSLRLASERLEGDRGEARTARKLASTGKSG